MISKPYVYIVLAETLLQVCKLRYRLNMMVCSIVQDFSTVINDICIFEFHTDTHTRIG